jgi:hypothetical protein
MFSDPVRINVKASTCECLITRKDDVVRVMANPFDLQSCLAHIASIKEGSAVPHGACEVHAGKG